MRGSRAFTLIELLITMGVMTLISAMVFFNFPKLNQEVLMNRAARELALAIRDAQARATAITQLPGAPADKFPNNYGIHVKGDGSTFQLFSDGYDPSDVGDVNNPAFENKKFDGSGASGICNNECVKTYTFLRGIYVNDIRDPASRVVTDGTNVGMSVLFYRPEPRMELTKPDGAPVCSDTCSNNPYGAYKIQMRWPGSVPPITRTIVLWTTGQIYIKNP